MDLMAGRPTPGGPVVGDQGRTAEGQDKQSNDSSHGSGARDQPGLLLSDGNRSLDPAGVPLTILDDHREGAAFQLRDGLTELQFAHSWRLILEARGEVLARRDAIDRKVSRYREARRVDAGVVIV